MAKKYPNWDYIFHQDNAPSHRAKSTIKWLNENRIRFIKPSEWMPDSPDAAPLDYSIWGVLKTMIYNAKGAHIKNFI